jgi:hypothetical protein
MTLTLPKLLLLAVIAWLVWTFLRKQKIIGGSNRTTDSAPRNDRANERAVEDMVKCPKCGAYVPAKGAHDCKGA